MSVTFQDPICQAEGCSNPSEAYVNVNAAMASLVPSRMEARCSEHGAKPFILTAAMDSEGRVSDHRAMIEQARADHADAHDAMWGSCCQYCQESWPCLTARLAAALDLAGEENACEL